MLSSLLLMMRSNGGSCARSVLTRRSAVAPAAAAAATLSSPGSFRSSVPALQHHLQQQQRRDYGSHRARRGLYDGKDIRSGNLIPFSMKKTRRKFRPNVFFKKLYSEALDAMVPFHVTTAALRSIDKAGGLDNYILKNDFTEGEGLAHKQRIKKRRRNQAYFDRKNNKSDEGDGSATDATAGIANTTTTAGAVPTSPTI